MYCPLQRSLIAVDFDIPQQQCILEAEDADSIIKRPGPCEEGVKRDVPDHVC